jgi:hypothetical protein
LGAYNITVYKYCCPLESLLKISHVSTPNKFLSAVQQILGNDIENRVRVRFLTELKAFPDPGNKKLAHHLRAYLLPGYALYRVLRDEGRTEEGAFRVFDQVFEVRLKSNRQGIELIGRLPFFFGLLRLLIKPVMRNYPTQGWNIEWREISNRAIRFDMKSCFYLDTLKALGAPELTASFCKTDDFIYSAASKHFTWKRKFTLGRGNNHCDFCFAATRNK